MPLTVLDLLFQKLRFMTSTMRLSFTHSINTLSPKIGLRIEAWPPEPKNSANGHFDT